jgi:[ribosomal protein S18]-alanine N-acetyltransferase
LEGAALTPLHIRRLGLQDVQSALAIQSGSPEIAQWTSADYGRAASGEMAAWVAEVNSGIAGFLIARLLVQETEILNLAVRADARRRGVGSELLAQAIDWSKIVCAERILLEVRASNTAALNFYERHGFRIVGRRPSYYTTPAEDALLLDLPL